MSAVLKLQKAENKILQSLLKVESDSIDVVAAETNIRIAQTKYMRADSLFQDGFYSFKTS